MSATQTNQQQQSANPSEMPSANCYCGKRRTRMNPGEEPARFKCVELHITNGVGNDVQ